MMMFISSILVMVLLGPLHGAYSMDSLEFIALQRIARQKIPRIIQVPIYRYPSASASMNIPTTIKFPLFVPDESQNEPKTVEAHSQSNNHPPIYQAPGSGYQNQEQQDNEKLRSYQEDDEPNEARTFIVYHKLPLNSHQMPGQNSRNT